MTKTIAGAEISNANDLLKFLLDLKAETEKEGGSLEDIYIRNGDGDDVGSVTLDETTLTDGSKTRDMRFWLAPT